VDRGDSIDGGVDMVAYIDVDMGIEHIEQIDGVTVIMFHDDSIWQAKVKDAVSTLKEAGYRVMLTVKREDADECWKEV
jgi:Fe-S cluster assembly ATPase SufC